MTTTLSFTPQQSAAIFARGVSVALSAGAGCGKTFVLTQRFLAGLQPDSTGEQKSDLHSLVAITFTERAAREMRDRIRSACEDRLRDCPDHEISHWSDILRGLDSARISTIHSFCAGLLRSQAVEAGLDPRFAVLEPPLADTLLRNVVRDTFHGLIEQNNDDAVWFVVKFGLERARELLRQLVVQCFQIDFARFADATPAQFQAEWINRWQREFVPKLVTTFRESSPATRALAAIADSPSRHATMIERIANLHELLGPTANWQNPELNLAAIRENSRVQGGGGKKDWVSEERNDQVKKALEKLREAAKKLEDVLNFDEQDVAICAELACRALRLIERISQDYGNTKRRGGVLDFDDLLLHARNLLRDNKSVRNRVAAGIDLLMVDEFQDTDPVQADLVRSLCGTALTHGKLFMVGDRKQSIYRFRRADPTVFTLMSAELPSAGRLPLNVNFRSQPAVLNFVNHLFASAMPEYEPLVPFDSVQHSPTPAVEFLFATSDATPVPTEPANDSATDALNQAAMLELDDDDSRPNAAQLRTREADWVARRIRSLLADPTPRIREHDKDANGRPKLRAVQPGDIVILFRALSNVQEYEAALRRYDLDYYLVGGKAFFAQQEVFDLLNLCRYLDDCDDLIGLVGILRSPFFNLSDDAIQALASAKSGTSNALSEGLSRESGQSSPLAPREDSRSTLDAVRSHGAEPPQFTDTESGLPLAERAGDTDDSKPRTRLSLHESLYRAPPAFLPEDQRHRIQFAAQILSDLRAHKDRIPLADLLNRAIEQTGYDASLLVEFLGSRKLANLRKLIETARQFDQGDFFTLKDFVTRLQTSVLEETDEEFATTLPENSNVIRLMSIHQSKGLEFPVVIVADIDRQGRPKSREAVLHPELGPLIGLPQKFGKQPDHLGLRMHSLAEAEADAEETIRLFYVACTRAADYLILSAGYDTDKKLHSRWMELVESRFDIQSGTLKIDPLLGSSPAATAGRDTVPEIKPHLTPSPVKQLKSKDAKKIPVGQIPGMVLAATPGELPASARIFPRDATDLTSISVSRLEAIDALLTGMPHTQLPKPIDADDEPADLDMATTLGMLIHAVMERVDFRDPANWPDLLTNAVRQSLDQVNDNTIEQAQKMLERFFDSAFIDELANSNAIYREIEFLLPWSSAKGGTVPVITGIIDLLIETEAGWQVLDYKTGEFPIKTAESTLLAPYELQLGLYAQAVEQWFGVTPNALSLITFRPKVRRITLPWSTEMSDQIRGRVDRAIDAIRSESIALTHN